MGDHQRMTNEQLAAGLAKEVLVAVASHESGRALETSDDASTARYAKSLATIYETLHTAMLKSMQSSSSKSSVADSHR